MPNSAHWFAIITIPGAVVGTVGLLITLVRGKSSEAAMNRHATAETLASRQFHKNFSTFILKMGF